MQSDEKDNSADESRQKPLFFDVNRKFVRILDTLPNGLIEFEFAIGDLDVAVELVMPPDAFNEFCQINHVEIVSGSSVDSKTGSAQDEEMQQEFSWNLHDATHQRFRSK